jgi:uncharacterized membrane protein
MSGSGPRSLESSIARLLTIGTYLSVALLALGVVVLIGTGQSPLDEAPGFDLSRIPRDILDLRPGGLLWLGIIGVISTPAARVVAALVGYVRSGEREMVVIAILILAVIAAGVVTGTAAG